MQIDYQRLYEDYLIKKEEKTTKLELKQFESAEEHLFNWLQKVRGLSPEQAQAVIDHSPISKQAEKESKK